MVLMSFVKSPIPRLLFCNDDNGTPRSVRGSFGTSAFGDANGGQTRTLREPTGPGRYGRLGRHAARHPVSLFETAMKGQDAEREELARLLHERHPRTLHSAKHDPEGERSA